MFRPTIDRADGLRGPSGAARFSSGARILIVVPGAGVLASPPRVNAEVVLDDLVDVGGVQRVAPRLSLRDHAGVHQLVQRAL